MKETYYFSHDYNAREDAKILNMMADMGWEGYGLYWMVIEKLAEANGKLLLDDIKGIAFCARIDLNKLTSLIHNFSLFEKDDEHFWSKRLSDHLQHRQKVSNIRAKWGRRGGVANAKQMLSKCSSKIKQSKGKESKGKEIYNIPPSLEEVKKYCLERNNGVDADKWCNFYSAKGWLIGKNKMKDWQAAVRTWETKNTQGTWNKK